MSGKTWFRTNHHYKREKTKVDFENKIIYELSVCTEGEAKGHGVHLEAEFIDKIADLGNGWKTGLLSRAGHPTMSTEALATKLGRMKNFTTKVIDGVNQVFADMHFYKKTHQKQIEEILNLADEDPESFGTSIVFTPNEFEYKRDDTGEKIYENEKGYDEIESKNFAEVIKLTHCDFVDDPAANDGLFSDPNLPATKAFKFLEENPEIVKALEKDPDKLFSYMRKFNSLTNKETVTMSEPSGTNEFQVENAELKERIAEMERKEKERKESDYKAIIDSKVAEFSTETDKTRIREHLTALSATIDSVEMFRSTASLISAPEKRVIDDNSIQPESFDSSISDADLTNKFHRGK